MGSAGIHHIELIVLALLMATAMLTTLARRFQTPYPIILVIGGLVLSLFPRLPRISLSPHLVFLVLLPPLVFSGAFNTSWREFRRNLVPIGMLAFGLVGFTVAGVAFVSDWLFPGFDWRLGCALGAVVSTTDTIAAMSIASRVGLPRKITDLIEGESLVNDASGLLALQFSTAMVVSGVVPSLSQGIMELIGLVAGGILVGLVSGKLINVLQRRTIDPPVEITLTLVAPYISYLSAESLHCSGVLATVTCGLYLGRKRSEILSTFARLDSSAVWNTLDFVLNGVLFILIGLQLPYIIEGIRTMEKMQVLKYGAFFSGLVIALRLIWVYPGAWIAHFVRTKLMSRRDDPPNSREVFLLGWTGMRGVLSLAAAISLPEALNNGDPFPQRNLIIFMAFAVILVTLVFQGLTLPAVIRKLRLCSEPGVNSELAKARARMLKAAIAHLEEIEPGQRPEDDWVVDDLKHHYRKRLDLVKGIGNSRKRPERGASYEDYRLLSHELRRIERAALSELRDRNEINDETLRALERELDLQDVRFESTVP